MPMKSEKKDSIYVRAWYDSKYKQSGDFFTVNSLPINRRLLFRANNHRLLFRANNRRLLFKANNRLHIIWFVFDDFYLL